jgi:hypothetical protein
MDVRLEQLPLDTPVHFSDLARMDRSSRSRCRGQWLSFLGARLLRYAMRSPARRQRHFREQEQLPAGRRRCFQEKVQTPVNRQRCFHSQKRIPVSRQLLFPTEIPLPVGQHRGSRNETPLPVGWPLHFGKRTRNFGKRTRTPARRQPVFLEPLAFGARPMDRPLTKTAQPLDSERFFWHAPRLLLSVLPAMTVSMQRTLASLRLPTKVPALVQVARAILEAMTNNRSFPKPSPSLAAIAAAIADLQAAEVATLSRTRGTAAVRDAKRAALVSLLVRLKGYVQGVADDDPERAETLIENAGMNVKPKGVPAGFAFAAVRSWKRRRNSPDATRKTPAPSAPPEAPTGTPTYSPARTGTCRPIGLALRS